MPSDKVGNKEWVTCSQLILTIKKIKYVQALEAHVKVKIPSSHYEDSLTADHEERIGIKKCDYKSHI